MKRNPRACLLVALLSAGCAPSGEDTRATAHAPSAQSGTTGAGGLAIVEATSARPFFHDFGNVPYGERLRHVFRLRNEEGRALVIQDLLPSCGCTAPRVSYRDAGGEQVFGSTERGEPVLTVPAGADVEIEVAVDTTRVEVPNLDKLSQVRVRTDSATNPYLTLELHLKVIKAFRAVPATLELGLVPQSYGKSARTDVTTCLRGDPSRILGVHSVEGTFTATLESTAMNGETVWIVVATAPEGLPIGPQRGKVVLATSGADGTGTGPMFSVPVLAQVCPDVVVSPGVLQIASGSAADGAELHAEMLALGPGAKIRVGRARLEGDVEGLELEARPIDADREGRAQRFDVVLRVQPGGSARVFRGTAVFETDDPHVPVVRAPVAGSVR